MNRLRRCLALLPLVLGIALFAGLIQRIGPGVVMRQASEVGWGAALLVLTCGARYFIRTLVWLFSIEPQSRRLGLVELFNIRLAGETFGELMVAGLVVGESAKAMAASRRLPGISAYVSLFIENLLFGLSVVAFLSIGVFVLCFTEFFPTQILFVAVTSATILLVCGAVLFLGLHQGWQVLGPIFKYLSKKNLGGATLAQQAVQIEGFEEAVHKFYRNRTTLFFFLLGLEFTTHWIGVFEAWWILYLIQGRGAWLAAFLVESANRLINSFFSIIPLRLGVDEGAMALVVRSIGYPGSVGVSLAIIRKARLLVWMVPGLFLIGRYSLAKMRSW